MANKLGDYMTITQVMWAMGLPRSHTSQYYRIIQRADLQPLRIGQQVLVPAADFCEAAGLPPLRGAWPTRLAKLPVAQLACRQQAAKQLGVSIPWLYTPTGLKKARRANLWPWGGRTLFIKENNYDQPRKEIQESG